MSRTLYRKGSQGRWEREFRHGNAATAGKVATKERNLKRGITKEKRGSPELAAKGGKEKSKKKRKRIVKHCTNKTRKKGEPQEEMSK